MSSSLASLGLKTTNASLLSKSTFAEVTPFTDFRARRATGGHPTSQVMPKTWRMTFLLSAFAFFDLGESLNCELCPSALSLLASALAPPDTLKSKTPKAKKLCFADFILLIRKVYPSVTLLGRWQLPCALGFTQTFNGRLVGVGDKSQISERREGHRNKERLPKEPFL